MTPAERCVLFVVDGMRPDGMLQASTPAMRRLIERGSSTLQARTVMPSITLPTHMSMFHSLPPVSHGVGSNLWQPMPDGRVPGIVEVVRRAGGRTAAFYTWEELRDLWRPGSMVYSSFTNIYGPEGAGSDEEIARLAADYLVRVRPEFTFIYLGLVDEIGHHYGWLSGEYLRAVEAADTAIAHVVRSLEVAGLLDGTACLVTADHGGHERAHGSDSEEDMTIPWLVAGPDIKRGYSITGPVRIYDTAPTIARLLDLPIPAAWQGQPVLEALE